MNSTFHEFDLFLSHSQLIISHYWWIRELVGHSSVIIPRFSVRSLNSLFATCSVIALWRCLWFKIWKSALDRLCLTNCSYQLIDQDDGVWGASGAFLPKYIWSSPLYVHIQMTVYPKELSKCLSLFHFKQWYLFTRLDWRMRNPFL